MANAYCVMLSKGHVEVEDGRMEGRKRWLYAVKNVDEHVRDGG